MCSQEQRSSESVYHRGRRSKIDCFSMDLSTEEKQESNSRRIYSSSYVKGYYPLINQTLPYNSKTSCCKLRLLQSQPPIRLKSPLPYSYNKGAFCDQNECLWIPSFLCRSPGSVPVTITSTQTNDNDIKSPSSSVYKFPPVEKIRKSWIWNRSIKPVQNEKTSLEKSYSEWSEWMHSPYLRKKRLSNSCESRLTFERRKINHKCEAWIKSQ